MIDPQGGKWEVRSITQSSGVSFVPSNMIGAGREFDKTKFLEKLDEVSGYILTDIQEFPKIPYWQIPVDYVRQWWNEGKLGAIAQVKNRHTVLSIIKNA